MSIAASLLLSVVGVASQPADLPVITVTKDDTVVKTSCVIQIPPGITIIDAKNDGAIQIKGDGITVRFQAGSVLRGSPVGTPGDEMKGTGIRIDGAAKVSLSGLQVEGYKVGLHATKANGLTLEKSTFKNNFHQHLRSTPSGEDGADWLFPHHNDKDEWITQWGGAVYIRESDGITVRDVTVREGQNGILINRVNDSKLYDNDASFLSGWGLGMFRSSRNTITRNALDFCVRGHVEGVYNRGQDSAGILCFEQCSNNVFAENSVTHGGDGFFAFAGLEALNGEGAPEGYDHTRKGCNDNLFIDNDFSYAPAHGLELTFSFGNKVLRNRFVENAICGIWGGYSQDFLIAKNRFEGNGGMAYGLERGGVNIEHGSGNRIIRNEFINNRCGVHLWWDGHGDFESKTWGKANYKGVTGNVIAGNTFVTDEKHPFKNLRAEDKLIDVQLRDDSKPAGSKVVGTVYVDNSVTHSLPQAAGVEATAGIHFDAKPVDMSYDIPKYEVLGSKKPVGARAKLRGRDNIIMTEWGPWDHASPMVRVKTKTGSEHVYELYGADPKLEPAENPGVKVAIAEGHNGAPLSITISAEPGVHAYRVPMLFAGKEHVLQGLIVGTQWEVTAFPWDDASDPRKDLSAWRALARSDKAVTGKVGALKFLYGGGGPRDMQAFSKEFRDKAPGGNHFGTIATSTFKLPAGKWKFRTLSDDGVRVMVNGNQVIERWNWHAPERDEAVFTQGADGDVTIVVEHFEIDGHSVLEFEIEPME